ncbi:hypothetical protein CGQ36_26835 [Nocardiopsis dassonvillei]|nr:hypothetical protein CGQ36_26835 [Nocardiopsis dassonvillei]
MSAAAWWDLSRDRASGEAGVRQHGGLLLARPERVEDEDAVLVRDGGLRGRGERKEAQDGGGRCAEGGG